MNKILIFLLVPCALAFVFVQSQYYSYYGNSYPGYYGGAGYGQGYAYPYYATSLYRRNRRNSLPELLALLGLFIYFLVATNLTKSKIG